MKRAATCLAVLLLAGCIGVEPLETAAPAAADFYAAGMVLRLRRDLFIERPGGMLNPSRVRLLVSSSGHYASGDGPASVAEYEADPARWPKIEGTLSAGTRLRVLRIEKHTYLWLEPWYVALARVETGQHSGLVVDLAQISLRSPDNRIPRIDHQEVAIVQ